MTRVGGLARSKRIGWDSYERHRLCVNHSYKTGINIAASLHFVAALPNTHYFEYCVEQGALRLVERSKAGHVVEVRLPEEIRGVHHDGIATRGLTRQPHAASLEEMDFLKTKALRQAIHSRERGLCFYCLRQLTPLVRCLDQVVPRARRGGNSCRNLVSCCLECNSQKGERPAGDFLRWTYREGRLTPAELTDRLRALDSLASGKLPPALPAPANPLPRKRRPSLQPL